MEQTYLAMEDSLIQRHMEGFLRHLHPLHQTIQIDGTVLDYAHFASMKECLENCFAAHVFDSIQLREHRAEVYCRTFGKGEYQGRTYEVRGRCRDEWLWQEGRWLQYRRYKLERTILDQGQVLYSARREEQPNQAGGQGSLPHQETGQWHPQRPDFVETSG